MWLGNSSKMRHTTITPPTNKIIYKLQWHATPDDPKYKSIRYCTLFGARAGCLIRRIAFVSCWKKCAAISMCLIWNQKILGYYYIFFSQQPCMRLMWINYFKNFEVWQNYISFRVPYKMTHISRSEYFSFAFLFLKNISFKNIALSSYV